MNVSLAVTQHFKMCYVALTDEIKIVLSLNVAKNLIQQDEPTILCCFTN